MIQNIYISHTAYCSGWNVDDIYKNTIFRKSARTMRFPKNEPGIKMLDWDYRQFIKNPSKVLKKHYQIAASNDLDIVMSMDAWEHNTRRAKIVAEKLKYYCDRVVIPCHVFQEWMLDYELALPNANWFDKNPIVPNKYRKCITHILGGSPHKQLELIHENPNVITIDGNQIYNVAIQYGKYWYPEPPYWRKPTFPLTNEEIFKISVNNMNWVFE